MTIACRSLYPFRDWLGRFLFTQPTVVAIQCASLAFASCNELHGQSSISSILAFLHLRISLLVHRLRFFVSLYSRWWPSNRSSSVSVAWQ